MDIYEIVFDDLNEKEDGVWAMSLVDSPANQTDFILLNDEKPKINFKINNEDKRLVSGVVLIPNQLIYRNPIGSMKEPFYMSFNVDVIQRLAFNFLMQDRANNTTLNHDTISNGLKMVESYLTKQENELGLDLPIGSWIMTYFVEDDELWQELKDGKFNGFSLEAFLPLIKMDEDEEPVDLTEEEIKEVLNEILKEFDKN